jgi:phosphatidylglycerophosphate synthase
VPASNLNPANAITASRFLTLPLFLWALERGWGQVAMAALILCGVLDLFDGLVARRLHCETPFGEVFDALADGLCYGSMLFMLMIYQWVPWEPVAIIIVLGALNIAMRVAYSRRAGRTTNYRSYAMERMTAYVCYLVGTGAASYEVALTYWAFPVLMVIVMIHDTKRMLIDPIPGQVPS